MGANSHGRRVELWPFGVCHSEESDEITEPWGEKKRAKDTNQEGPVVIEWEDKDEGKVKS